MRKVVAVLVVCMAGTAAAHPGGTNAQGCHSRRGGGYHCHTHGGGGSLSSPIGEPPAPLPEDAPDPKPHGKTVIPAYVVLASTKLPFGGTHGAIMVRSLSRSSSAGDREAALRGIMKKEGLRRATLYCSKEARMADLDESYRKANPGAVQCILGAVMADGSFVH